MIDKVRLYRPQAFLYLKLTTCHQSADTNIHIVARPSKKVNLNHGPAIENITFVQSYPYYLPKQLNFVQNQRRKNRFHFGIAMAQDLLTLYKIRKIMKISLLKIKKKWYNLNGIWKYNFVLCNLASAGWLVREHFKHHRARINFTPKNDNGCGNNFRVKIFIMKTTTKLFIMLNSCFLAFQLHIHSNKWWNVGNVWNCSIWSLNLILWK